MANQLSQGWVPPPKGDRADAQGAARPRAPAAGLVLDSIGVGGPKRLEKGGAEVTTLNLYSMKFDPRLSADERRRYLGPTAKDPKLPPYPASACSRRATTRLSAEDPRRRRVCVSDVVVQRAGHAEGLARPRVFTRRRLQAASFGTARLTGRGGLVPCLDHISKMGIVSTYGAPRHITNACGDMSVQHAAAAILPLFSADCAVHHHGLYEMDCCDAERRAAFLNEVERYYGAGWADVVLSTRIAPPINN